MERYPVEIFQIKYQIKNVLAYNITYTFALSKRKLQNQQISVYLIPFECCKRIALECRSLVYVPAFTIKNSYILSHLLNFIFDFQKTHGTF